MPTQAKLHLVGHPIGHSKSPAMHNAAYRALGLDWHYDLLDCATADEARAVMQGGGWLALNVTMPYKPLARECAQQRSAAARLAGGANVLVNWDGQLYADNTDGKGCVSYLQRCGVAFEGARAVVCGTGPTSLAIMHACVQAGASHVSLLGRDADKAGHVLDAYLRELQEMRDGSSANACGLDDVSASASDAVLQAQSYSDGLQLISDADVIVDATPLGMKEGDPAPFDTSALSTGQVVMDVVYGHGTTQLAVDARAAGCRVLDGSGMLVAQAVETVIDIKRVTGLIDVPEDLDLFTVMSAAAGFEL